MPGNTQWGQRKGSSTMQFNQLTYFWEYLSSGWVGWWFPFLCAPCQSSHTKHQQLHSLPLRLQMRTCNTTTYQCMQKLKFHLNIFRFFSFSVKNHQVDKIENASNYINHEKSHTAFFNTEKVSVVKTLFDHPSNFWTGSIIYTEVFMDYMTVHFYRTLVKPKLIQQTYPDLIQLVQTWQTS